MTITRQCQLMNFIKKNIKNEMNKCGYLNGNETKNKIKYG